jgi:hypothetical protein
MKSIESSESMRTETGLNYIVIGTFCVHLNGFDSTEVAV